MKQCINHLIEETSPYLLQHAHHPVNWEAWRPNVFEKAKKENKLVVISIGYSSCHWCHVMAHESFEDEEIGALMNKNFINIKVDREERPDVDQVYMNALQLMTGKGGWPLNIIALPDGRPVWGGTYFRKEQWEGILHQLNDLYRQAPEKMIDYAEKLTQGIREMESLVVKADQGNFDSEFFKKVLAHWETHFDLIWGGSQSAPKFMMPNNYHFLLRYASQTKNKILLDFVIMTLDKMSFGGIYDQLGGGFSRYSTDEKWHVPHFEKMLYDNAQLVSLYCDAFLVTKNPWYKKVVKSTLEFVKRELTGETSNFYCALDADSINEQGILKEGAYYVWTKEELQKILKNDFPLFSEYFNINETGHWEKGHYVLMRTEKTTVIAEKFSLSENTVEEKIALCIEKLMKERNKRNAPGLDDKSLTSWNALMLKGYIDAYRVFHEKEYLEMALKNATFLLEKQVQATGKLFHSFKNGKSSVNGYLEDYAFTIEAFFSLYENTFAEKWLRSAEKLTEKVLENFYDSKKSMFYFVSKNDTPLIARTVEYQDNVMPSSNSVMAKNLFKLSHYLGKTEYHKLSEQLLKNILPHISNYPEAFSNWLDVLLNFTHDFYEVAILGEKAKNMVRDLNKNYVPNKLLAGKTKQSDLPLLKNRWRPGESLLYVCENNRCKLPVKTVEEALKQMI